MLVYGASIRQSQCVLVWTDSAFHVAPLSLSIVVLSHLEEQTCLPMSLALALLSLSS